mgnify:CR=1 FL=1
MQVEMKNGAVAVQMGTDCRIFVRCNAVLFHVWQASKAWDRLEAEEFKRHIRAAIEAHNKFLRDNPELQLNAGE